MINQYKRVDVFRCQNRAHAKLGKWVSVYHVLKVKKCYPDGCIYFRWKCRKLNKGETCPRGYKHVGRLCFGCKYFYDEKVAHQLQFVLPEAQRAAFWDDLDRFEDWLSEITSRRQSVWGSIHSVKPHLEQRILGKEKRLTVKGFLLVFRDSYIGQTHFEDFTYAVVSRSLEQKFHFRAGDEVEFNAEVTADRGRIVYNRLRQVEFSRRVEGRDILREEEIPFLLKTATEFGTQPEKCLYCPYGTLVDVVEQKGGRAFRFRRLFCLKGVSDAATCVVQPLEKIASEGCPDSVKEVAWENVYK